MHLCELERLSSDLADAIERIKQADIQKSKLLMDANMDLTLRTSHK